jgi:hypothetical protein
MTDASGATTTRAAVLERPGVATRLETLVLDPPGAGEVRVRMAAAGVCHSDLHVRDGEWEREGPIVLGHEGSAVVEALGEGVAARVPGLRVGGLVALAWLIPCGACRSCRAGRVWSCSASPSYTHRMPGGRAATHRPDGSDVLTYCAIGTFAERQNVPAAAAIPVPEGTPPEVAALIGCCVTTGVGAAMKTAEVERGVAREVDGRIRRAVVGPEDPPPAVDERERLERRPHAERSHADEDGGPAGRQAGDRGLDRGRQADRLEARVGPAVGHVPDRAQRLGRVVAGEEPIGGADRPRQLELRRDPIDGHDPGGAGEGGPHHARQADPAEADDHDR